MRKSTFFFFLNFIWPRICLQCRRPRFDPWVGKSPWRRKWQLTPVFLVGNPVDREAWQGCSPRRLKSRTRLGDRTTSTLFTCRASSASHLCLLRTQSSHSRISGGVQVPRNVVRSLPGLIPGSRQWTAWAAAGGQSGNASPRGCPAC